MSIQTSIRPDRTDPAIPMITPGKCINLSVCMLVILSACWGVVPDTHAQTNFDNFTNAVNDVRLELETTLGKPVPSLSVFLQTSSQTFFTCSAATPAQAVTTNTTFRFASNTKNFTATAVLSLHQQGLLNITDRIVDSIPGTSEPYVPATTNWDIPYKNEITIQQLLRHSAGVYDVDNDPVPGCGGMSYTEYIQTLDPSHQFNVGEMVAQDTLYQLSYFPPDKGYHYSNTGFAILSEIVARVYSLYCSTNKTLSDYLYEHIIGGTSPVPVPEIHFPNLATDTSLPAPWIPGTIYYPSNVTEVISNMNMSAQVGEGNGYGTLPAMNRYIRSLMTGSNVLSSEMVRLMQTNTSPYNANYGLGCSYNADLCYGHNGARIGNLSLMAYNPDTDVSITACLPLWDLSDDMVSFMKCFGAMYSAAYGALEAVGYPRTSTLSDGTVTNLVLTAGETNVFHLTGERNVYYGISFSNRTTDVLLSIAPAANPVATSGFTNRMGWTCPIAGTYRISVSADTDTSCALRLYTFTNTIAQTTALITNHLAQYDIPACGVVLVDGDQVVWTSGFGTADPLTERATDADTVFGIASVSKTIGTAGIMQMVEHYGLDLDAPLTNYIPEFSIHQRFTNNIITPRTILTHHSGIPGDMLNGDYTYVADSEYRSRILQELSNEYTCQPTNFAWAYNNSGFTLLSAVIENLSGTPFADYMYTNVLLRCGMTNSSFLVDHAWLEEHAARPWIGTNSYGMRAGVYPWEYCNGEIAGGIFSTPNDMAHYLKMLLADGMGDNGRVISTNSLATMVTQQNVGWPLDAMAQGLSWIVSDLDMDYAGRLAWHDGSSAFYNGKTEILFDQGLAGYVVCNSIMNRGLPVTALQEMLQQAVLEKSGIPVPTPYEPPFSPITNLPPEQINLVTGLYAGQGYYSVVRPSTNGGIESVTWSAKDGVFTMDLVARENGMFSPADSQNSQYYFTNVQDHFVFMRDAAFGTGVFHRPIGDRCTQDGCSSAWSNRFGTWLNVSVVPYDYSHYSPIIYAPVVRGMRLFVEENALMAEVSCYAFGRLILEPGDDNVVFSRGFGRSMGCAIQSRQTNGYECLCYLGCLYRAATDLPFLDTGATSNGTVAADETIYYRLNADTGTTYVLDLATTNTLRAEVLDPDFAILGAANNTHAFRFEPAVTGEYYIALSRNGDTPGDFAISLLTNQVPFYRELPFAQWPVTLQAYSNLYPNTDFGYVFVPDNHTNTGSAILKLAVAVMHSTHPNPQPIIYCNGGPGASSIVTLYQYYLKDFLDEYTVILPDQRGINLSQPGLLSRPGETVEQTQYRLAMLEGSDLGTINTEQSALDVDTIAQMLNLTNVNLWGGSYGTFLVQQVMRADPPWLRSAILDGPVAPEWSFLSRINLAYGMAINALERDVAASTPYYPDFEQQFQDVAWAVASNPVPLEGESIPINDTAFFYGIRKQLQISQAGEREYIPSIIWRAAHGNTAALIELFTRFHNITNAPASSTFLNMQGIVMKHDFIPFDSLTAAFNNNATLPACMHAYADFYSAGIFAEGDGWDVGVASSIITQPVHSTVPTLLMTGTYDPQASTNWAAQAASTLSNAWVITFPGMGHGALMDGPCPFAVVRNFLTDPSQDPSDYCLGSMALDFPPPWPSNTAPLIAGTGATNIFTQAGQGAWYTLQAETGAWYLVHAGSSAGSQILYIVDTNAAIAASATNSMLRWHCERSDTYYLWLVGRTNATFVVRYTAGSHPGGAIDDFDGDGLTDVAVFWPQGGNWYLDYSAGGDGTLNWGWDAVMPAPADYDGDGCCDLATYNPETGEWYLRYSSGGTRTLNWGWNATIPAPGDFDGDGRADVTVYHPDSGNWYMHESGCGALRQENWGWDAALPAPADYDGDGLCDLAVYWPEGGQWYLRLSSTGLLDQHDWGWDATLPVPADYDGDGLCDLAVYWPEQGMWFILGSGGGGQSLQWGWSGVIPLPGDYDGDGRADMTVYDQANGTWYIRRSSDGQLDQRNWGWNAAYGVWPQMWINWMW